MIPSYLSPVSSTITSAVANHIWQSTLLASVVGLLTLALRNNQARVRYWLWFAASMKFLIPFSWLIDIGSHIARPRTFASVQPTVFLAIARVSQPFTRPTTSVSVSLPPSGHPSFAHMLPEISLAIWLCGFILALVIWCVRWRRASATLLKSVPVCEGREVSALQRLENSGEVSRLITLLLSPATIEPGIFGILRPVLVWPRGISERLEDEQLEAILAHEMCHVRYCDNLTAAIHMLVEAIFWFHPFVWWLGARLVEERERACDEVVLQFCRQPHVYAESILKVCQFCVESPLVCISGVTGSDLKKRIVRIMTETEHNARRLNFNRKLLLFVTGLTVIAAPIVFGQVRGGQSQAVFSARVNPGDMPSVEFDVASIKPNNPKGDHFMFGGGWSRDGFTSFGTTLHELVKAAYGVQDSQVTGGPGWVNSDRYNVKAKMSSSVADYLQKLSPDQREIAREHMLQVLLADRFHMVIHHETMELPVYALVKAKDGPKLREANPANTYSTGFKAPDGSPAGSSEMEFGGGQLMGQGVPISVLVSELSQQSELAGRALEDRTGLTAMYDFTLQWTPQASISRGAPQSDNGFEPDASGASLFTALRDQLGLRVESTKGTVDTIAIDRVEQVSEN
jgi:bla regulator protein blaR1